MNCSRCDKELREGGYVYSRFTKNRYCIDYLTCDRRMKRALSKRETGEHELTADQAGAVASVAPSSRSESVKA